MLVDNSVKKSNVTDCCELEAGVYICHDLVIFKSQIISLLIFKRGYHLLVLFKNIDYVVIRVLLIIELFKKFYIKNETSLIFSIGACITKNFTLCEIGFSDIKKMPLIYIFSVIIIDFYFKFHYKVI